MASGTSDVTFIISSSNGSMRITKSEFPRVPDVESFKSLKYVSFTDLQEHKIIVAANIRIVRFSIDFIY